MTSAESLHRIEVTLPKSDAEISAWHAGPEDPWALLVIAHGAGAGARHPFFDGFTDRMHDLGIATIRFNFPYFEQGRRMPGPATHAIATWHAVMRWSQHHVPNAPAWAAGKSYGGRMASMAAAEGVIAPAGLVYLGYPLHPPGEPAKERVAHLPDVGQPQLFVEGTNDPFIAPHDQLERAVASCQNAEILWIPGGGHSFEVKGRARPADQIGRELSPLVADWMRERA